MSEEFTRYLLDWMALHAAVLVPILSALVPVLALCLAGYALYLLGRNNKGGRK